MSSIGMIRSVALVRNDVSEERIASIIRVTRTNELRTFSVASNRSVLLLLVTANVHSSPILVTLMMEAIRSVEKSVLTRFTGVTSQKTEFFIVTAVKNSNLTQRMHCWAKVGRAVAA
jgi:hypothetical protein